MAVNFYVERQRLDKNGDAQIRVSISITGARLLTSTGIKIAPSKWNTKNMRVKKGSYNACGLTWTAINTMLNRIEEHFGEIENGCLMSRSVVSVAYLKEQFSAHFRKKTPTNRENAPEVTETFFWECYKRFVDERGLQNQWSVATFQKFNALKRHLSGWRSSLSFDDFSESGLNEFVRFLRDNLYLKNSTIGKQLGYFKWFLRWATLNGYNTNTTFQTFSPKLKKAIQRVVFLEWEELMRVMDYNIPENGTTVTLTDANGKQYKKIVSDAAALAKARDIFCFCCFTSLRYSDASNLKKSNISDGSITITTIKTADTITIELNKYSLAILKRYKDTDLGGYALPRLTNQRMNIYLKDLCELCEINQFVTHTYYRGIERIDETMPKYEMIGTHTGRRTFICNALMLGIPAEIVMKWTGHADYKSMKPYIDVTNTAKKKAMSLFDDL